MSIAATSQALAELSAAAQQRDAAAQTFSRAVIRANEAGLSQREIARVLGVTQPAVSQMISSTRARAKLTQGPVGRKLAAHRAEVLEIARSRGASRVRVFGSVARGEDTDGSDVDLLVDMPGEIGIFALTGLSLDLEDLLGVPVDVIPEQIVKREMLSALAASAVTL